MRATIRFIRALRVISAYAWRAAFVWGITEPEDIIGNPLFEYDRQRAKRIWRGEE